MSFGTLYAHSYTVEELVALTIEQNPKLKEAWQASCAAHYDFGVAASSYYPKVSLQQLTGYDVKQGTVFSSTTTTGASATPGATLRTRQLITQLTASYLLFDFGVRKATVKSAQESFFSASYQEQQLMQDTILGVLGAYYLYVNAAATQDASLMSLNDTQMAYEAAQVRVQAGVSSKLDLLQLRAQLSSAELSLAEARGNVSIALAQLASIAGLPPSSPLEVDLPSEEIWESPALPDVEKMVAIALTERKEVAAAHSDYEADRNKWLAAKADGLPKLSLDSFWNNQIYFRHPSSSSGRNTNVTLTLDIPLYRGGFYTAQANSARSRMWASQFRYADISSQVSVDVVMAYHQFQTASSMLTSSRDYLFYAQESLAAILVGYRSGTSSILDLLSAQKVVADARAQWVTARGDWLYAIANAAHATGTLRGNGEVMRCH